MKWILKNYRHDSVVWQTHLNLLQRRLLRKHLLCLILLGFSILWCIHGRPWLWNDVKNLSDCSYRQTSIRSVAKYDHFSSNPLAHVISLKLLQSSVLSVSVYPTLYWEFFQFQCWVSRVFSITLALATTTKFSKQLFYNWNWWRRVPKAIIKLEW